MGTQIIVQLTSRALKDLQKVRGFNDLFYLLSCPEIGLHFCVNLFQDKTV